MSYDTLHITESNEALGAYDNEPQLMGLFDHDSIANALDDPETLVLTTESGRIPIVVPVRHCPEVNQTFFDGSDAPAYYYNYLAAPHSEDDVVAWVSALPSRARIMLELSGDNDESQLPLFKAIAAVGKTAEIDPTILDPDDRSLPSVHHFYSPLTRPEGVVGYDSIKEAFESIKDTEEWSPYADGGVKFVTGSELDDKTLEGLWDVYDATFDKLVENLPSAQKQPRDDFLKQMTSPGSIISYIEQDGTIVSALYIVDNVQNCGWLNGKYFDQLNPDGQTVFMPGISTRLDMKGYNFSKLTIGAMSTVIEHVPAITGTATQCTNRSVKYIPDLANEFTEGSTNLDLKETRAYRYPVYLIG